ncbi:MAG: hypothetical protein M1812_004799 [Candelaria pacifica]|nr:MAG: hypothetical protein M1812_004799 [Candelaria pacifica]
MGSPAEIQALLRFLSQDAKVPLATAMGKVKILQERRLTSFEIISKTPLSAIQAIFPDEKLAKQVFNAARRLSKKRSAGGDQVESPKRRKRNASSDEPLTPAAIESSLALPSPSTNEEEIMGTTLITNRAPLVLAFAVALLKYTMPEQPLSSRLSLAQAVVSVNSKSKAISLGLEKGTSAENEGWGQGQPGVNILGRSVRVLKRWGYDPKDGDLAESAGDAVKKEETKDNHHVESEAELNQLQAEPEPALWGLDLEALRSSNGPPPTGAPAQSASGLPIYSPHSARAYILKSFASAVDESSASSNSGAPKKKSGIVISQEKERNLGLLLGALDLLYGSWVQTLDRDELDRRAWTWYVHTRPEVESGVAGWGGKGQVKLSDILGLRRKV